MTLKSDRDIKHVPEQVESARRAHDHTAVDACLPVKCKREVVRCEADERERRHDQAEGAVERMNA